MDIANIFEKLELPLPIEGNHTICSPVDGFAIASIQLDTPESCEHKIQLAKQGYTVWRRIPPPVRGELVRLFAEQLRKHKLSLARLITVECGKIQTEAEGEVQEMIDICDFAIGLSRQLHGLTISSERPEHSLREIWQPYGTTGIITAFNFPMAVWAWNAALALICGNSIIWKPSEKTPLCAIACQGIIEKVITSFDKAPSYLSQVIIGKADLGQQLVESTNVPLISATGSCRMGQKVGAKVAERFGRSILELGGNNAVIVTNNANLDMAIQAIIFGAVGTAGQRCTTTRRVFIQRDIFQEVKERLLAIYPKLTIGNPLSTQCLVGPLIDKDAFNSMQQTITKNKLDGCEIYGGERVLEKKYPRAFYVKPAIIDARGKIENSYEETFAPILYLFDYQTLEEAIQKQNAVKQGLSSSIFTNDIREAEFFLSAQGSDCGIANVNVGTSGAEIGGAFGGEKHTGGGRESGSDAWKNYMRRMTATVNYSESLPLSQGVEFTLDN